jgi:secondary thiamine-phosphate synthase enzyme
MSRKGSVLRELPILVIVALAVSLLIKTFLVQFFYIPSGSMENTLQIQDRVAVNKLPFISKNISRGDVVVFRDPANWLPEQYVDEQNKVVAKIKEGLVLVNAMHITASVFINDDESGLHHDYKEWLEAMAPHEPVSQYRHNDTGEDNADAHIKRQIMGREVVVAITAGKLDFGPWEQIFYGEFDGRRKKRVLVKIIGE